MRLPETVRVIEMSLNDAWMRDMGPKIDAVCQFVEQTGKQAAIGSLYELAGIIDGQSGTAIAGNYDLEYYQ